MAILHRSSNITQSDNLPGLTHLSPVKARVTIPYISGLSETFRRILSPLDVQTTFRPNTLVRPKDRIPDLSKTGVVHRVSCAACPMSYVGQTGRRLQQRVQEHDHAVRQGDTHVSALAEHTWEAHHPIKWSNTTILDGHPQLHQRLIRTQPSLLNREDGLLPVMYDGLFNGNVQIQGICTVVIINYGCS